VSLHEDLVNPVVALLSLRGVTIFHRKRYRHRLTTDGRHIYYVGLVGRTSGKRAE
jgi:hypothetical protein